MDIKVEKLYQEDAAKNRLFLRIFYNEKKERSHATLHLRLKSEGRERLLGHVDFTTKTFYCKRDSKVHYHYKTEGYGFNWTVINDSMLAIEHIHLLVDDKEHYTFPKTALSEFGKFLNFKEQGFELQKFLSLKMIQMYNKS